MTSEALYSQQLTETVENYKRAYLTPLQKYQFDSIPTELVQLIDFEKRLATALQQLQSITVPPIQFDPVSIINSYYDNLDSENERKAESFRSAADAHKAQLTQQHEQEVADVNKHNKDLLKPIEAKHRELLDRKDQLKVIFKRYDITPLDIKLSDDLTFDEFSTLIDESIDVCNKYERKDSQLFDRLLAPLKNSHNNYITFAYTGLLLAGSFVLLPTLAIPMYVHTAKSVHNLNKDLEKLRVASTLMAQVDYKRFVNPEDIQTANDLDLTEVESDLEEKLCTIEDIDIKRKEALAHASDDATEVERLLKETQQEVNDAYCKTSAQISELLQKTREAKDNALSKIKRFPTVQNDSVVMSHDYILSRKDGVIDVPTTLPLLNIIFDSTRREESINLMKLYLANALLSVRVKQLTVEIYDPKNMGGDFTEFVTPDTKPYIKINETEISKMLETYRKYAQENVLALDKMSIDEYNKDAEERELVPKEYKLLILISNFKELKENQSSEQWFEFVKFSATQGVMIWILDDQKYQNTIWVSGTPSMQTTPIQYAPQLGKDAVATFSKALRNYKDTGIDYVSKFGDVYIPRDKWWTYDTIKGILMPYGLEGGDPTRGLNVAPMIGDANVHALLGGATGAGKSAAINQLLISLITMYPPSELKIVYIDFKNVEAAKFTAGYDTVGGKWMDKAVEQELRERQEYYTRLSRIPHLQIISGTTDGEYALSVFEYLMGEMAHRQEIINKFGVTKVEEMRKQILAKYNTERNGDPKKGTWADMRRDWEWYKPNVYDKYGDLPRLLVIFDEFQVMYNPEFVEAKIIDTINGKITAITKLARAMGAHFWFTSQSMKGTMSKDTMSNFSLRGALRCSSEVSEELIGNGAAGTIRAKFGFMYTNDTAGESKEANRLWRVPFLDEKAMPGYIDQLNDMLKEFNEKHLMAEFYDEKILVPAEILDKWYKSYDAFNAASTFIVGERANYSTNKAPVTMKLVPDSGENVLISAFDRDDMLNLTMTLVRNLQNKNSDDYTLIMNVQDKDTYTLMDVDNLVSPAFLPLASPKQDVGEFVDALEAMVNNREDKGGPYKPVFVFCIQWERAPGVGADVNYKLHDQIKSVMRKAPTVGVHFIMCCKDKGDLPRSIPAACNHRICGLIPKDSYFFIETSKVEKLPSKDKDAGLFAFYEFGTSLSKLRIYQHTYTKQLESRDVIL